MTDLQQNGSGTDKDNATDFSDSDSRVDAIAALAVILILAATALYFVAGA